MLGLFSIRSLEDRGWPVSSTYRQRRLWHRQIASGGRRAIWEATAACPRADVDYPLIVAGTLGVGHAMLAEAAISYLGLGVQPPNPSWGNMLYNAQSYLWQAPTVALYPGVMIALTVLCINFVGDGLRDALDARMTL